ncbi:MAG: hypothetical protein HeimC2_11110 [Candidatus Heimdallarchaeota archaeon LC_2]|nr:MAG: hypothetical protein HeimC2_11110 [Candidatus Heimdallarchaeota archaeon LC_2]
MNIYTNDLEDYFFENDDQDFINTEEKMINEIKKRRWKYGDYKKQSWKNWLHSMAPYVGRITPSFAHWLIRSCSTKNDVVLDPFCGVGTIPLEADLLGRKHVIGVDLNPYAYAITNGKFDRAPLEDRLNWIDNVELNLTDVNIHEVDIYAHQYYHEDTLKEIISIRNEMIADSQDFLLGCLLGIIHGHRPQYLSAITGYIIPYVKKGMKPDYKNVKDKLKTKVKRMYRSGFPMTKNATTLNQDIRNINLGNDSIDVIICSPPYYDTLDYVAANHLRLIFLGYTLEDQIAEKEKLIQNRHTYLNNMEEVGHQLFRLLKKDKYCIFVLGDVVKGKKTLNTAADISNLYQKIGFEEIAIIEDKIPVEKSTYRKFGGENSIKAKKEKSDRILVLKKP